MRLHARPCLGSCTLSEEGCLEISRRLEMNRFERESTLNTTNMCVIQLESYFQCRFLVFSISSWQLLGKRTLGGGSRGRGARCPVQPGHPLCEHASFQCRPGTLCPPLLIQSFVSIFLVSVSKQTKPQLQPAPSISKPILSGVDKDATGLQPNSDATEK